MAGVQRILVSDRAISAAHAALGIVTLAAAGGLRGRAGRAAAALLGARHLAQSAVLARPRDARTLGIAAGVDALHALSMMAVVGFVGSPMRRPALASAAASSALAAGTLAVAARRVVPPGRPLERRVLDWGTPPVDGRPTRSCLERWSSSLAR